MLFRSVFRFTIRASKPELHPIASMVMAKMSKRRNVACSALRAIINFKSCIRNLAVFSLRVCGCGWSQVESETFRQEDTVPLFNVPLLKLSFQAVGDGALAKA